ncbi:MAG: mycothione reductase [Propionibacteriales bacterium]|nr:mycothione reductase [Propionibacteriales bacterium]
MPHHDLIIIGTGSGNSIPDERFADLDIAIVDEGTFGGTCLNVGCIPTKMFVHTADLAAAARGSSRLGVDSHVDTVRWSDVRDRIFGRIDPISVAGRRYRETGPNTTYYREHAWFVAPKRLRLASGKDLTADAIVLAAGSRAMVPAIPGLGSIDPGRVHTSDTVMRIDSLPQSIVVLGGGVIAAEMAHVFSALGTRVTVVARGPRLLRAEDAAVSDRFTEIVGSRWDLRLSRQATGAESTEAGVRLHLQDPTGHPDPVPAEGELLLVATGRVPNSDHLKVEAGGIMTEADGRIAVDEFQRTSAADVYALGDISSPDQLKHVANHEARIVAHNLLHPQDPVKADHRFVPHAVFSGPQVAAVGKTEAELVDAQTPYVSSTQAYGDVAYGWAMEDTTGFVKLLADPASGLLLGAHIVGPQASSVIQPLIQAMSFGLPAHEMARGQYWIHPAMPEVVENALLQLPLLRRA